MTNNKITFEQVTDAFDVMRSAMAAVGCATEMGMMTQQGFDDCVNCAFIDLMKAVGIEKVEVNEIIDGFWKEVSTD